MIRTRALPQDALPAHQGRLGFNAIDELGIGGYASIFGNVDSYGEVISHGAFKRSLEDDPSVLGYYGHRFADFFGELPPIGRTVELFEDEIGLRYTLRLGYTAEALDVLNLVADGILTGSSFSFVSRSTELHDEIVHHTDVKLLETSPVAFPANELATAGIVSLTAPQAALSQIHTLADALSIRALAERFAA